MKRYKNMFQTVFICLVCLVTLCACGEESDSASSSNPDNKGEDAVVVYYVKEHPFYQAALEAYQRTAQVSLELHAFDTEEELAQQYTAEGLSGGGADVVLLSDASSLDAEKLMSEGICFDLTEYLEQDQNYKKEDYFEIVMDAGKLEGKQYILPITFDMGFAVARNTVSELCGNILTDDVDCYAFYEELLACQQLLYDSEEIRLGLCFTSDSAEDFLLSHWEKFFDQCESNPLTQAQRRACINDDDNTLVVAGAGSGKTSTIISKCLYLIQSGLALPEQILRL